MLETKVKTNESKKIDIDIKDKVADLDEGKAEKKESSAEKELDYIEKHLKKDNLVKTDDKATKEKKKGRTSSTRRKSGKSTDFDKESAPKTPQELLVDISKKLDRVQREMWYTRIALAIFLVVALVYVKLCVSDINETMSMFLQFLMGTMSPE